MGDVSRGLSYPASPFFQKVLGLGAPYGDLQSQLGERGWGPLAGHVGRIHPLLGLADGG